MFELKAPPALSKDINFEGPKNQLCAEISGLQTMFKNNVSKACLTDSIAILSVLSLIISIISPNIFMKLKNTLMPYYFNFVVSLSLIWKI